MVTLKITLELTAQEQLDLQYTIWSRAKALESLMAETTSGANVTWATEELRRLRQLEAKFDEATAAALDAYRRGRG